MKKFKFRRPKLVWTLTGIGAFFAFLTGLFFATLPNVAPLKNHYPVFDRKSGEMSFSKRKPSDWVSQDEISDYVFGAIIVSEDWTFFSHNGVDWGEMKAAIEDWWKGGRLRGASTLTQQLAKNIFYSNRRSYVRKLREFFTARDIEEILSKKKILENYVNIVEMGPEIYGIKRAARFYFGKPPSLLNPKESAFIAMVLPSPKKYSQSFRARRLTDYAEKTMTRILKKMARKGFIAENEVDYWVTELLAFEEDFELQALDSAWAQLGEKMNSDDMDGENMNTDQTPGDGGLEESMVRYEDVTATGEVVEMEVPESEATPEQREGQLPETEIEGDLLDSENGRSE